MVRITMLRIPTLCRMPATTITMDRMPSIQRLIMTPIIIHRINRAWRAMR